MLCMNSDNSITAVACLPGYVEDVVVPDGDLTQLGNAVEKAYGRALSRLESETA